MSAIDPMVAKQMPWSEARWLPRIPAGASRDGWGWVDAEGAHQTHDPADVSDALAHDAKRQVQFAWKPAPVSASSDAEWRMQPVYEISPAAALGRDAAARARTRQRERRSMWFSVGAVAVLTWMIVSGDALPPIVVIGVLLFAMSPFERALDFVDHGFAEKLASRDPREAAARGAARLRYGLWAGMQGRSRAGIGLAVVFGAMFLLQTDMGLSASVGLAGLVKSRVLDEPYRLLTCAYLHGGVLHLVLNGYATLILARALEPLIGPGRVLLAFVWGALVGSLASWALMPVTSVGASGGIMAFVGVMAGLALCQSELRGVGLHRIALRIFVLMGIAGLVGSEMIDSAAHAGGALAGVGLGALFARRVGDPSTQQPWTFINALGVACAALPALWTLAILLGR